MAAGATAVLLLGLGAALRMSVSALDAGEDTNWRTLQAARAADQVAADLAVATQVSAPGAGQLIVSVPDRTGDGVEELIEYAWSGSAGDAVTRTVNGRAAVLAEDVHDFTLSLAQRTPPVLVESATGVLASMDDVPFATKLVLDVKDSIHAGFYVRPVLPAGTVEWKITRVRLRLMSHGLRDSTMFVRITESSASRHPTSRVLAEAFIAETSFPLSMGWVDVPIGPVTGLLPSQGVCVTFGQTEGGGKVCTTEYEEKAEGMPFNTHWMTSLDGGATWTAPSDRRDARFFLYGTTFKYQY